MPFALRTAPPERSAKNSAVAPCTHQFLVTLTVQTNKINPAATAPTTSARSMTNNYPLVVILRDGQQTVVTFVPAEVRVLPVRHGVATVGVLVLAAARPMDREAVAVVESALPNLAVALTNALNHQDLQRVAALDPLTSVYNRRFGVERLKEEVARSQRSGDSLGLLILDLDHFKSVNDTYGHLVGDRVLQSAVLATRQVLRDGDVLVRYGGEEFLVILPGAGRGDLTDMAERIRRSISETEIVTGGHRLSITVSIGGAGLPDQVVRDPAGLIGIAYLALYSAKATGRDRSVIA